MLASAVNLSEGRDQALLDELARRAGPALLDRHADAWHNRAVLTLAGDDLLEHALALARGAVELLDLAHHEGVHPRLGVLDVVPFAPISDEEVPDLREALAARDEFATRVAHELGLPCFLYGPERSLPTVRAHAFKDLAPDVGPPVPHPRAGACCVGARPALVAYNLWLEEDDLGLAKKIARELRSDVLRALGLQVGAHVQVSCNLIAPFRYGPMQAYDDVAERARIARAELVGLLPMAVLAAIPEDRYRALDLSLDRALEVRLRMRR